MTVLDRYITRQLLINFFILLVVLFALIVLFDLVLNLDEFLEVTQQPPNADEILSSPQPVSNGWLRLRHTAWLILDWHAPLSALAYVHLSGLLVLGAMGFTFCELTRRGELIAVMGSGVSLYRVAAPVLVIGCGLNLISLPIQELVIPPLATKLARSHQQIGLPSIHSFPIQFAPDGDGRLVSASRFDPQQEMLTNVHILEREESGLPRSVITADQGLWDQDRTGWELLGGYRQTPTRPSDLNHNIAVGEPPQVDFWPSSLTPQTLIARQQQSYPQFLSIAELQRLAKNAGIPAAQASSIIHKRLSITVVNLLVLMMGLPFFLGREPVNLVSKTIQAVALCLGAWLSCYVVLQLGADQLNPVTAAWLPVVIYLPIAAYLMQRIKT